MGVYFLSIMNLINELSALAQDNCGELISALKQRIALNNIFADKYTFTRDYPEIIKKHLRITKGILKTGL